MSPKIAVRRPAAVDYERTFILSIEVSDQVGCLLRKCLACRIQKRSARSTWKPRQKWKCTLSSLPAYQSIVVCAARSFGHCSPVCEASRAFVRWFRFPTRLMRMPDGVFANGQNLSQRLGADWLAGFFIDVHEIGTHAVKAVQVLLDRFHRHIGPALAEVARS
jgi:hypothetical protein